VLLIERTVLRTGRTKDIGDGPSWPFGKQSRPGQALFDRNFRQESGSPLRYKESVAGQINKGDRIMTSKTKQQTERPAPLDERARQIGRKIHSVLDLNAVGIMLYGQLAVYSRIAGIVPSASRGE
jgi:hypothetical protein